MPNSPSVEPGAEVEFKQVRCGSINGLSLLKGFRVRLSVIVILASNDFRTLMKVVEPDVIETISGELNYMEFLNTNKLIKSGTDCIMRLTEVYYKLNVSEILLRIEASSEEMNNAIGSERKTAANNLLQVFKEAGYESSAKGIPERF